MRRSSARRQGRHGGDAKSRSGFGPKSGSGGTAGAKLQIRALLGKRVVAKGTGAAGSTVTLRFTKAAKRSLARKATVRLRLAAGSAAAKVTLRR